MRYLRHSSYDLFGRKEPVTTVIPEESLKDNIWTAATNLRALTQGRPDVDIEIFEFDGEFIGATAEAANRSKSRMDRTQAHRLTLYDWLISLFTNGMLNDKASISTTRPSPLDKKDLFEVIMEAVRHPKYRGFKVQIHDKNGELVSVQVDAADK